MRESLAEPANLRELWATELVTALRIGKKYGGRAGTRTPDLLRVKQAL